MLLEPLQEKFSVCQSVCQLEDFSQVDLEQPFTFVSHTDGERSLVCLTADVPDNTTNRDDGWRAFRISGTLDFSLIGILAKIADVLARGKIGIFAISTYDTDYILTKENNFERALDLLRQAGYEVRRI